MLRVVASLTLLLSLFAQGSLAAGDRATARLSITKLATASPPLPSLVMSIRDLDDSALNSWARTAGARLTRHRVDSVAGGLETELIIVAFE